MKKLTIVLVIAAAFVGGYGYGRWYGKPAPMAAAGGSPRKILYWVDPMHPQYKSDKPGIAPDCGMKLEPVYADGRSCSGGNSSPPEPSKSLPRSSNSSASSTARPNTKPCAIPSAPRRA
jgi:Cu(I)/Ag(I) efflux system membrane fusion protein